MPAQTPFEVLASRVFREGHAFTEAVVSKPLQVALGTDLAGQLLSAMRDSYAMGRQTGDEALEQTWQRMRLASHGEVARVAGLVVQVDDRVAELEDRLASLEELVRAQNSLLKAQAEQLAQWIEAGTARAGAEVPEPRVRPAPKSRPSS
ncbi:MAG: hypothetical protein VKO21_12000 [Candidatus Sericytochromatia bacterium]|nr:hypothetical protein [Candidatus Sericytochromatia bacterium]